ncbi:MAG: hypothetical protein UU09_C0050G0004 [Microgenomates group bacterium GW2011_GWA2_40_6]|nr:MAG: hypothetical protein UU09_C0050G0004 [Microgenomates group bacterium GW2011_GWA2_40_6]
MDMEQKVVSLTSQNQITLPINMVKKLGKNRPKNMIVSLVDGKFVIKPVVDIWSLAGAMKSDIKATDRQLRKARSQFEKTWAREM